MHRVKDSGLCRILKNIFAGTQFKECQHYVQLEQALVSDEQDSHNQTYDDWSRAGNYIRGWKGRRRAGRGRRLSDFNLFPTYDHGPK